MAPIFVATSYQALVALEVNRLNHLAVLVALRRCQTLDVSQAAAPAPATGVRQVVLVLIGVSLDWVAWVLLEECQAQQVGRQLKAGSELRTDKLLDYLAHSAAEYSQHRPQTCNLRPWRAWVEEV
jgi:hypothetical protein